MLRLYVTASKAISKLKADLSGATAIEYGLLAAGIALTIIVAIDLLSVEVTNLYNTIRIELKATP